jgi:very-short-patch-repair endonuclease
LKALKLPLPVPEHRFSDRRWRFDFAYPSIKLAIEIEGGLYTGGRHTRGAGYEKDLEKYNSATLLGWRLLRFSTGQIKSGYAAQTIFDFFKTNGNLLLAK